MKDLLRKLFRKCGLFVSKYPIQVAMGYELWRDIDLLLGPAQAPFCIDVGANVGDVTAKILSLRPGARVHAFEPSQLSFAALQKRFSWHPEVRLVAAGLGDEAGEKEFIQYENGCLSSFLDLQRSDNNPFADNLAKEKGMVPVQTLAAYCRGMNIAEIDLLKIDTQGYDRRVLGGADELLKAGRVRLVLVELNFISLYVGQADANEVMNYLSGKGFQLVDFYEKCRRDQHIAWCTALFIRR